MFLKSKINRAALACFLVLSMFGLTFADTIRLKDGSIIKGKITNFGDGKFTIVIGDGARQRQMNFFADEVDSIEFDATQLQTSNNYKTTLPVNTNVALKKDPEVKNTQVITVGQTETKPTPQTTPQTTPTPAKTVIVTDNTTTQTPTQNQNLPMNTPVKPDNSSKPISLSVKVLADNTANGWSNSGWVVKKGQRIRITGKGQINLGSGRYSSASGISSIPDKDKLLQKEATGGLIAVVGDDNNDFIFVGSSREFVATRDGALFLGINEGNLEDNSGAFDVTVEILP